MGLVQLIYGKILPKQIILLMFSTTNPAQLKNLQISSQNFHKFRENLVKSGRISTENENHHTENTERRIVVA